MTHEITTLNVARFCFWMFCIFISAYIVSVIFTVAVEATAIVGSAYIPQVCQNLYGK